MKRLYPLVVLGAALGLVDACIIADPPTDLPRLPLTRPTIVRGSVVPSPNEVLTDFPVDGFVVFVELSDPTLDFEWRLFLDYDPLSGDTLLLRDTSHFSNDPAIQQGRVRKLVVPASPTVDRDRCHQIELVVGLQMAGSNDLRQEHTPAPPGGDSITWTLSPNGTLRGCPVLDAGIPEDAGKTSLTP